MVNMHPHIRIGVFSVFAACTTSGAFAQHPAMPPGMTHDEHLAQVQKDAELKKRGAVAMGFDQDKTTHHFRLYETGGAIEVVASDPADKPTVDRVREHLKEIASEFARGDFGAPLATHGERPPGVETMQERVNALAFRFEDTGAGGRVRITTSDVKARNAVHAFLRYQIREHATGDPLTITKA
jgi:hypothetical protein